MRTEKQIAASRLNGRKSSGATTSEGKARIVAANEPSVLPEDKASILEVLSEQTYVDMAGVEHTMLSIEDDAGTRSLMDMLLAKKRAAERTSCRTPGK